MSEKKPSEFTPDELLRIEQCIDLIYQARFYWISNHIARSIALEQLDKNPDFVKNISKLKFNFSKEEKDITFSGNIFVDNYYLLKKINFPIAEKDSTVINVLNEARKKRKFNKNLREQWRTALRMNFVLIMEHILNQYVREGSKTIRLTITQNEQNAMMLITFLKNYLVHPDKLIKRKDIEKFKGYGFTIDKNKNPHISDKYLFKLSEVIINALKKHIPEKDFSRCSYRLIDYVE